MATIEEALSIAFRQHQAGQLAAAEGVYRQILDVQPQHHGALHLLGALCLQATRPSEAIEFLERAVSVQPTNVETLNNLGGAYQAAGRWQDSVRVLESAIELSPEHPKLHFDLGNAWKKLDQKDSAVAAFEIALRLKPDFLQALNNLGTTLTSAGRTDEAIASFQKALALKPDYANALNGLGNALLECGQAASAISHLQRAAELLPQQAMFHCNLGVALKSIGDPEAALQAYNAALRIAPDMVEARKNLANLYQQQQHLNEAAGEFEAAIALHPHESELHLALGDVRRDLEEFEAAGAAYDSAAKLLPDEPLVGLRSTLLCPAVFASVDEIQNHREHMISRLQQTPAAELSLERAEHLGAMPPFNAIYQAQNDRELRETVAAVYGVLDPGKRQPTNAKPTGARLRIGFVITNGHEGIFCRCMAGLLDRLNRDRYAVVVMAPAAAVSAIRSDFSNETTEYITLPDRLHRMVDSISQAEIDILYHWECGTDVLNYLLPFLRLAPLQCTGWGLPVTSGIPAMDFYLSSKLAEPSNAADHYSETLIQAQTLLTWQEPIGLPENIGSRAQLDLPCESNLYVCAQNLRKFHPDFDDILRQILQRDSNGMVVLVEDRNPRLTERLKTRMARSLGPFRERVIWRERTDFCDYLRLLAACDVALDPLHFGSGITAYEIFSVAVPLVTLPGEFRRGRFVSACYRRMGIDKCVTANNEHYVSLAVSLGTDPLQRQAISAEIELRRDILFRDETAVTEFEAGLQHMWATVGALQDEQHRQT